MESLAIAVLLILIILLVLVVFLPAYLERLSRANRLERDRLAAETTALERDMLRLERLLAPFARARSEAYRSLAVQAAEQLATIKEDVVALDGFLNALRIPTVFDYLLPAQHFVMVPEHIGAIVADARLVRQMKRRLNAAHSRVEQLQALVDSFASIPARLGNEQREMARRLAAIDGTINKVREGGIEALDDFVRDTTTARRLLNECNRALLAGAALNDVDAGALALESVSSVLAEAEARAATLERERAALDRRLQRTMAALDQTQATTKSGLEAADLPQIRPLLRRAAKLLNESAPDHRRRREFNAAGADVSTAAQLIAVAQDVLTAEAQIRTLVERDDGVSLSEAIHGLQRELAELLERLGRDETEGHYDSATAAQAAQLRTRTETLLRRQDDAIADLLNEAVTIKERVERSWGLGRQFLRLANDDPLARRYTGIMNQFTAAQDRPAALAQFRQDASSFENEWEAWTARVQTTRTRIEQLRASLPPLIDQALTMAAPWKCLAEDVTFIQQRAANFETIQTQFNEVKYRRAAESLMVEIQTIESDIESRFAQLRERAERLTYLDLDVNEIIDLALGNADELPSDHPDRAKWDRALRLIDHHRRSAHAAIHYEDASVALLRAADAANKLAL